MAMGSADGMLPLRGSVCAAVKTAVFAQVGPDPGQQGAQVSVKTQAHSSFARLADAHTFADLASTEIVPARSVCAIQAR